MAVIGPGANAPLPNSILSVAIAMGQIPGAEIDISGFLVDANGKVRSDDDMCFYGQPEVGRGALKIAEARPGAQVFILDPSRLPVDVEKVIFSATIHENKACFAALSKISVRVGAVEGEIPCAGMGETALLLAEIYRRSGEWKIRIIGQGFKGGLSALATHLGVSIEDAPAPSPAPAAPAAPSTIRLEKQLINLQKQAPEMVSLVKKVQISLEKKGLSDVRAKVCLCLDISGSMSGLYSSGKVDTLVKRAMALGYRFDDDGAIDVFLFGSGFYIYGQVTVKDYGKTVVTMLKKHRLEGDTKYGKAFAGIRKFYAGQGFGDKLPIFVMFATDGDCSDRAEAEREIKAASHEPIFWKFMGIGAGGMFGGPKFEFLKKLDDLKGRKVDNAHFFEVKDPSAPSDEQMFDLMMTEYKEWADAVRKLGMIA